MKKKSIITIILLIMLDQLSKLFIVKSFKLNEEMVIIKNFFKFEYVRNTGISFGLFSGMRIIIIILTIIVIGLMIYELIHKNNKFYNYSCILIISGAIGNLIDRIFRGYVVDFISFTILGRKMAIFNIADICICFGVALYILLLFMEGSSKDGKNSN